MGHIDTDERDGWEWPEVGDDPASVLVMELPTYVRTARMMKLLGVETLGDLAAFADWEIQTFRGVGKTVFWEMTDLLQRYGLTFTTKCQHCGSTIKKRSV